MDEGSLPYGRIRNAAELGRLIRKKRLEDGLLQEEVAGLAQVGVRFLSELENGKETAALGKSLQVLSRLGLEVRIVPRGAP
jgi:y4mF family transcriptional regulator